LAKDCTELGSDEGVDEDVLTFELVFTTRENEHSFGT